MGRRDSLSASKEAANNNIPAPNSTVDILVAKFENVGLTLDDMVALSGKSSSYSDLFNLLSILGPLFFFFLG